MKAANDNGFVTMLGGGNSAPTLAMLERFHDEIAYVDPRWPDQRSSGGAFTVYVIGGADPEHVKIGKAGNVVSRLRSLQTGNPLKLYVHRKFAFNSVGDTTKVEAWAHEDAGRLFGRAVGEWFRCSTVEAHELIAAICEKERIKCRASTPEIEHQWRLDEPAGRVHLEREAERRRLYWAEREQRDEIKYGKGSAK